MRKTTSDIGNKIQKNQQAEHLKELLKEFGITSRKNLIMRLLVHWKK